MYSDFVFLDQFLFEFGHLSLISVSSHKLAYMVGHYPLAKKNGVAKNMEQCNHYHLDKLDLEGYNVFFRFSFVSNTIIYRNNLLI